MSLVMAGFVVWGFSRTVNGNLLHASTPKPGMLWFHGAIFSAWVVLFIAQSALVRVRKVGLHRALGRFGAALAATMFISGIFVSPVMLRFDMTVLRRVPAKSFMSILWCDIIIFGVCMALAIYFRKRPQYHRRHDFYGELPVDASCLRPTSIPRYSRPVLSGARRADRGWNVARRRRRWPGQQGLCLWFSDDARSAGMGHLPGACQSQLVAWRDASDFRGVRSAEWPVSIDLGNSIQLLTSGRVAQLRVVCRRSGN
jgi:uncharacterized membrane protein